MHRRPCALTLVCAWTTDVHHPKRKNPIFVTTTAMAIRLIVDQSGRTMDPRRIAALRIMWILLGLLLTCCVISANAYEIRMPDVQTQEVSHTNSETAYFLHRGRRISMLLKTFERRERQTRFVMTADFGFAKANQYVQTPRTSALVTFASRGLTDRPRSFVLKECKTLFDKYIQLHGFFTGDSSESRVYDILQLNTLHTGRLMLQLVVTAASFDPIYNPEATHHMILFGCDDPTYEEVAWQEEEAYPLLRQPLAKMDFIDRKKLHIEKYSEFRIRDRPKRHIHRNSKGHVMYVVSDWMPTGCHNDFGGSVENTSFKIGGKGFRNLVLQVHYKDASYFTQSPLVAMACRYTGEVKLHPFAFRTHAHSHGLLNAAYVIHHGVKYLIGEKSPQEPQTFYPVLNKSLEVQPGDKLLKPGPIIRCTCNCYYERRKHTRNDEMCNFYMMYSVPKEDAAQLDDPKNQNCLQSIDPKTGSRLVSVPHNHHHGLKTVTEIPLEDLENEQEDMYFNPFGQILE
ncbi:peptidylglycine monooxygenase [Clonorchis sinensis]|uniref:Peptidylglycine monooxygenase n=1 Tax=Clonorchis sinensis TaxID=79923 RepID=G7YP92_CLOSI|nr:peptidylglycine monooxygenase [Clonorchis sinensis]